jgi:dTDP-glucose 4,6-dehydratase
MYKNLLVTGGCGFIGSNFINYYLKKNKDIRIINLDAMYYCADELNILEELRLSDRYQLVKGNLCSKDLINHVLNSYKIDSVIHFAAQSHVQNSFEDSLQYTNDNILGTHTLLECCRKYGKILKFIHISTDEVYGESLLEDEEKKNEQSILCPTNPYAATKAGAELIANSYRYSFKMPIIITRGNNVYGPNQYPEKLIPRFIKLLKENKKVTIQGDGSNVRAFLHTNDVVRGLDLILNFGEVGNIYNIGSDEDKEYTVIEIAQILIKLIKKSEDYDNYIEYIDDRPFNDKRYYISNEKLKNLGWSIEKDFIKGLKELL